MKLVDPECHTLAEYFLGDDDTVGTVEHESRVQSLAEAIQDAVETWMEEEAESERERDKFAEEQRSLHGYTDEERARI